MSILLNLILIGALAFVLSKYLKLKQSAEGTEKLYKSQLAHSSRLESDLKNAHSEKLKIEDREKALKADFSNYRSENDKYSPLIKELKDLATIQEKIQTAKGTLANLLSQEQELRKEVDLFETHKELKESGFFSYKYKFEDIMHYKEALQIIRTKQKELIGSKSAVFCNNEELEKSPIVQALRKLTLKYFNAEFEAIADRLNYSNFDSCKQRVIACYDLINEELSVFNCEMDKEYLNLKVKELALALEYELEQQKIKDEQIALREQMRDEEAAREEAEAAREKAVKEEKRYEAMLEKAKAEAQAASAEDQKEMESRIADLENKLKAAHEEKERATSLAQITRKGHVYVISNIGSFGENVFKIGLTRREDPLERVKELGDASVPFKFDVHAIIPSEDAPTLEMKLHQSLDEHRINRINTRKEFFRVTLDRISSICKELGCSVQITQLAEAREYRETIALGKKKESA